MTDQSAEVEPLVSPQEIQTRREEVLRRARQLTELADVLRDPERAGSPAERMAREHVEDVRWDRNLRISYGLGMFLVLVPQLIVMNCVLIKVGYGEMHFSDVVMGTYMAGTLAEVFLVVREIIKYLFRFPK